MTVIEERQTEIGSRSAECIAAVRFAQGGAMARDVELEVASVAGEGG